MPIASPHQRRVVTARVLAGLQRKNGQHQEQAQHAQGKISARLTLERRSSGVMRSAGCRAGCSRVGQEKKNPARCALWPSDAKQDFHRLAQAALESPPETPTATNCPAPKSPGRHPAGKSGWPIMVGFLALCDLPPVTDSSAPHRPLTAPPRPRPARAAHQHPWRARTTSRTSTRHPPQPAGGDHGACRAGQSPAWRLTRCMPRGSGGMWRACRPGAAVSGRLDKPDASD